MAWKEGRGRGSSVPVPILTTIITTACPFRGGGTTASVCAYGAEESKIGGGGGGGLGRGGRGRAGQEEFSEEEDGVWEDGKNCLRRRKTGTRSVTALGVIGGA